ncbi:MAG: hypothetical protein LPK19_04735, partial [Hymenobacteraceae bacterium]|nr:hypothetical protein [Hymenobacteraceae bacterium]MDX5395500.1 hypothetical protein [Hymenobacteraceae bacterium]MDX5511555.1 hypothetical protein [Hymenobacteraceae bacterium]
MKRYLNKLGLAAMLAGTFLTACEPEIEAPAANAGEADFSRFIALGNSLTAGMTNGALYREGQLNSYPNILAQQLQLVGGGEFTQPLIEANSVGIGSGGNARFALTVKADCRGTSSLMPVPVAQFGDVGIFLDQSRWVRTQGPFNNLGVPGAKSFHLIAPNYGDPAGTVATPRTANPFFMRFASDNSTTILRDALPPVAPKPTFFSLWIGNQDALAYALEGGTADQLTPQNIFEFAVDNVVTALVAQGAKGVVANIPDVTSIPFFTTVPYNGLTLDTTQAAQLTAAYGNQIKFRTGANPFIINEDGNIRPIKPNELILLDVPQDSIKCRRWGSAKPIP